MIVRRMSAYPIRILINLGAAEKEQFNEHVRFWAALSSPKAEVTSSNLVGRATFSHFRAALSAESA